MTLIELLVSTAIGSILVLAVASLMFYTGRSFAAMVNYVELDAKSRIALDTISYEIRQAKRLIEYSPTKLVFEDAAGETLSYIYDPEARTLTQVRTNGDPDKELLTDCSVEFSIYQRNPRDGEYEQYEAATADTCKLVQLHWVSKRTTLGDIINTESVQSAKVVIRKQ